MMQPRALGHTARLSPVHFPWFREMGFDAQYLAVVQSAGCLLVVVVLLRVIRVSGCD